jgi:long-chain fatty acid transport protein
MGKKCLLVLCAIVACNVPAFGSGFVDTYAFGARALSLGGAFTAVADDYSAAYYNPAGLAQIRGNHFNLEYIYTSPKLEVQKLNGEDLVVTTSQGEIRNDPTEYPGGKGLDLRIPIIGLSLDINDIVNIPMHVQLGMAISLPEQSDVAWRILSYPPDQPHFIRYGNDIDRIHAALGIGLECWKDLVYFGLGVQAMLYGDGYIYVDGLAIGTGPEYEHVIGQAKLSGLLEYDPIVGLLITPLDKKLKIGLSYREKEEVEVDPLPTLIITDIGDAALAIVMGLNAFYTPREISLGVSYAFDRCMVSAEANLQKWSDYAFSPEDRIYYAGGPDFDDTINYRIGLEYKLSKDASFSFGYCHQPTPVPNQSGKITNYLDMDKDLFSFGGRYTFQVPFALQQPMTVAGVVHYQKLDDLTVIKDGVVGKSWVNQESYTVKGNAYAGGVSIGLSW